MTTNTTTTTEPTYVLNGITRRDVSARGCADCDLIALWKVDGRESKAADVPPCRHRAVAPGFLPTVGPMIIAAVRAAGITNDDAEYIGGVGFCGPRWRDAEAIAVTVRAEYDAKY